MALPKHLNCKAEEISHCDFYMHRDCEETCAYARDIKQVGIGAICDGSLLDKLKENNNK